MKRFAYFLILLVFSAQVDDYWFADPLSLSAVDDDEYLPLQQRPQEEACFPYLKSVFPALKAQTANFALAERDLSSEPSRTSPVAPPSLYVFMSLQV